MKRILISLMLSIIVTVCRSVPASAEYVFETIVESLYTSSLALNKDGVLWIKSGIILTYDGKNITTVYPNDKVVYVPNDTMAFGPDGDVWFGGSGGLMRYDGNNWTSVLPDSVGGVPVDEIGVLSIAHAPDGSIWAGAFTHGLLHFDGAEWSLLTEEDGLVSNQVVSIAAASDGRLWIGTFEGLSSYYKGEWTTYTTENGLNANYVSIVAVDKNDVLWCNSNGLLSTRNHKYGDILLLRFY